MHSWVHSIRSRQDDHGKTPSSMVMIQYLNQHRHRNYTNISHFTFHTHVTFTREDSLQGHNIIIIGPKFPATQPWPALQKSLPIMSYLRLVRLSPHPVVVPLDHKKGGIWLTIIQETSEREN